MKATILIGLVGFASALYGGLLILATAEDRHNAEVWVCIDGLAYVKQHGVLVHVEWIADNVRDPKRWVECYEAQT
jgi:hypothetical protein